MADTRHLRLCGLQWHVVVAVPRPLRSIIGQTQLKRSLRTDSLAFAQQLRWPVVQEFKLQLARAGRANGVAVDPLTREAIRFNEEIKRDDALIESGALNSELRVSAGELLDDHVSDVIAPKFGEAAARKYKAIASGRATPIMLHLEAWLGELTVKEDTKDDHRLAVRELTEWGKAKENNHTTLQDVTQKVAGKFAAFLLKEGNRKAPGEPMSRRTVAKRRSSLAAYWDWLTERDHLAEERANPWRRLRSLAPKKSDAKSRKREFTSDEMRRLFYGGEPDAALKDYMLIGALSGMRIDEIARLKVSDCKGGTFSVLDAKTPSGIREVPIHSELRKLVDSRSKGRPADAWLIEDVELGGGHAVKRTGKRGDRSMPVSKRFGRFRQSVGVHDQREGERQSAVDFHSFRRWFTQQAKDAGIPEYVTAAVVGHKYGRMTYGLYAKNVREENKRECVETAKLPTRSKRKSRK